MAIEEGARLEVTTASGQQVVMRALSGETQGRDFAVVWVCTEAEYEAAQQSGSSPKGIPWPLEAVKRLVDAGP